MSDENKKSKVVFEFDDDENKESNSNYSISSGLVFTASLFIGMGIGSIFHNTSAGTLLGLGVGFLLMAIIKINEDGINSSNFRVKKHSNNNYVLAILGVFFIIQAIAKIVNFNIFSFRYSGSTFLILLGIVFLVSSGIFSNKK